MRIVDPFLQRPANAACLRGRPGEHTACFSTNYGDTGSGTCTGPVLTVRLYDTSTLTNYYTTTTLSGVTRYKCAKYISVEFAKTPSGAQWAPGGR